MINLIGTIGLEATASEIRNGLEATSEVVELYIDSPGGDVVEANAISLALSEYALTHAEKQYVCIIGSLCASAAANIVAKLPSAYTIKAYKDSLIMYHSCSAIVEGTPEQLKDFGAMMNLVNESVIRELMTKTNLPIDEIKSAFCTGRELWLDGTKAKACGLVSELIDAEPDMHEFKFNEGTRKVLELVAKYKTKLEKPMEEEDKIETTVEETTLPAPEEPIVETVEAPVAETELEKKEIEEEVKEELNEPSPEVEVDWEAKCGELEAECGELKKELEALKALVAKYQPTVPAGKTVAPKADWLSMVRELNAKHLNETAYANEYIALKKAHEPEFRAFMQAHSTRKF